MPVYLKYKDPVRIMMRDGSTTDPYVDVSEYQKIINNRIVLTEIPDTFTHVIIVGYKEIFKDPFGNIKEPASDEFIVDYTNGIVTFNESEENKTVNAIYKGRGYIQYPAERIYCHNENPDVVENLQDFIDRCNALIIDVNQVKDECIEATQNAIDATNNAINATNDAINATNNAIDATNQALQAKADAEIATQNAIDATNNAIEETNLMHEDRLRTRIIWKDPVDSFDKITTIYPTPDVGWTTECLDNGNDYRFDGLQWQFIGNRIGAIPKANETLDGLMSKEEYIKLQSIEYGATGDMTGDEIKSVLDTELKTKTIVFVLTDNINVGLQDVEIRFPYDGIIRDVHANCGNAGTTMTEIAIEKCSESDYDWSQNWVNIFSTNLTIDANKKTSKSSTTQYVLSTDTVNKNDYFRINVINSGMEIKNLIIEINIEI